MDKKQEKLKHGIKELKREIYNERKEIKKIEELIKKKIEREPGIWEYDFNELESEMWDRYSSLEKKIKILSEEISECSGRSPKNILRFFKNLRGNLIRQNVINQEIIPFYLAIMLSLQKIKDRLNYLEYKVEKTNREIDDLINEFEEYKSELGKTRKK